MPRRRSLLNHVFQAAGQISRDMRRAARERERAARRERAAGERQTRALSRLAKEQEREESLASAAQEHQENEELLAGIRDLLLLAPKRRTTAAELEQLCRRAPFPPPDRLPADAAQLEKEIEEKLAGIRPPVFLLLHGLQILGILAAAGGGVLAIFFRAPGLAATVAGAAGWIAATLRRRKLLRDFFEAERARLRAEIAARQAHALEADRLAHERAEDARIARIRGIIAGEGEACRESFNAAFDELELPLDASAVLAMAAADAAEIQIQLHAADGIPAQRSTLLKSGRLSYRNRPKKESREDDARSIASLALLAAAAAFARLPSLEAVLVTAFREGIDPATGQESEECLMSSIIDREPFLKLKLDRLDPIAALRSMETRFSCSAGFALGPTEPFRIADLWKEEGAAFEAPEAALPRSAAPRRARAARPRAEPRSPDLEIAQHVLDLLMACGRADGRLDPAELQAIARVIGDRYPLEVSDSRRLALRQASLAEAPISIDEPARALRTALGPRERQLLMESVLSIVAADGALQESEAAIVRKIGAELDVSAAHIESLIGKSARGAPERPAPASPEAPADAARGRLEALELPPDAAIERLTIERACHRVLDIYSPHRFELMSPELQALAAEKRRAAEEARGALLASLPPEPAAAPAPPPEDGPVRRDNPDLDSIFG